MNFPLLLALLLSLPLVAPAQATYPARKPVAQHAVNKPKTKARQTPDSTVYYCAGSSSNKYHTSSECEGLAQCRAIVVPLRRTVAQESLQACKLCY